MYVKILFHQLNILKNSLHFRFKPHEITVRLGEYDFGSKDESMSKDFRVVDVKEHPEYDQETYENDISILKIHRPTDYDDFIRPICLPSVLDDFENKTATVTGTKYFKFLYIESRLIFQL